MSTDQQPYYQNPGAATHPPANNYYLQQNNGMEPRTHHLDPSFKT